MPVVQGSLKTKKSGTVPIPGGCLRYIHALDVSWNEPFNAIGTEKYNVCLEIAGIH